jgi:hypothetical protein
MRRYIWHCISRKRAIFPDEVHSAVKKSARPWAVENTKCWAIEIRDELLHRATESNIDGLAGKKECYIDVVPLELQPSGVRIRELVSKQLDLDEHTH